MTGGEAAGLAGGLGGAVLYAALVAWGIRRARRTYSRSIVKHLTKNPRAVVLKVSARRGAWNPAGKEVAGRLFANGLAEYTLDEAGAVHLRFLTDSGQEQHFHGPVPEWHNSHAGRRRRRLLRGFYAIYLILLIIGFALGYLLSHGSAATRLVVGVVVLGITVLVISVAATFVQVALSVRTLARDRRS